MIGCTKRNLISNITIFTNSYIVLDPHIIIDKCIITNMNVCPPPQTT